MTGATAGPAQGMTSSAGASTDPGGTPAEFACVTAAWRGHERELRSYVKRALTDGADADDLLQDVFLKALRQGRRFCVIENPRAWLFQVARNVIVDRARAARRFEPLDEESLPGVADDTELDPVDALVTCVDLSLAELSPADAEILRACDLEGGSQQAYAEARGISLTAAKARLMRARKRLRDRIALACRVRFDADTGRVSGHDGRTDIGTT